MNLNVILVAFSCQCLELTINFNTVNDNLCVLRVFARVLSRRCLLRDMFLAKAPRWLMIIDYWLLMTDCWLLMLFIHGLHGCPQADGDYCWWLIADCYLSTDNTDNTDDTDSQDMVCVQVKSVESVESVGHEGCWGTLKPTDYTDGTDVRMRTGIIVDDWLLIAFYPRITRMTRMSAGGRGPGNRYVQDWSCPWWMDMWGMCVFKTLVWGMVRDKTFPPVILVGCGRVGCPDN